MNFLIVIPCCDSDKWLAEKNLEWCKKLDGQYPYEVLISYEQGMDISTLKELCGELFTKTHEFVRTKCKLTGWPYPQNKCFQDTARHIKKANICDSFFWWEADCTPLKAGWLKAIQEAYEKGGKPFGGPIVKLPNGGHFNGVSVYPADVGKYSLLALLAHHEPWDRLMKKDVGMEKNVTDLDGIMMHLWVDPVTEQCPTFPDWETVQRLVKPDAYVWHRNKDGSLLERLTEPKKTFLGGLVEKLLKKKSNHCVLCYLPPKGIGHTDVFLEHMADFPPDCPIIYITDGDWPKSEKITGVPVGKSDKIATYVFLTGLQIVRQRGFSHFIYIETDCRFARKGWDSEFLKGIGDGIIGAGNLAVCNMDKADKAFKNEFHRLHGKHPFVDKPGGLKHSTVLGQQWPGKEPLPFVNGAPAIYSVEELYDLFGSRGISELMDIMPNQDRAIAELAIQKYTPVETIKKWKHLPTVMATAGFCVYPIPNLMSSLRNGVCAVHPIKNRWRPPKKDGYVFHSSGDYGDLVLQLKSIQLLGGGRLVLSPENRFTHKTRAKMTLNNFEFLKPLVECQPYITSFEFSEKLPKCDYDFNGFRDLWHIPNTQQPSTLVEMNAWYVGAFELFNWLPWVVGIEPKKISPIVVHRSARYHSKDFPWKKVLETRPRGDFVFCGLFEEWKEFTKEFGNLPYYQPLDAMDMARVISGAEICVVNQSLPDAIALGIGKTVFQETWSESPDCVFQRDNFYNQHKPLEKI